VSANPTSTEDTVTRFLVAGFVCTVAGVPLLGLVPIIALPALYGAAMTWAAWELEENFLVRIGFGAATFFQFFGTMLGLVGTQAAHDGQELLLCAEAAGVCGLVGLVSSGLFLLPLAGTSMRTYARGVAGCVSGAVTAGLLIGLGMVLKGRPAAYLLHPFGGLPVCLPSIWGGIAVARGLRQEMTLPVPVSGPDVS